MFNQYQVLLIGRKNGETTFLREKLTRNKLYRIETSEVADDAVEKMTRHKWHLVVLNLESFTPEKIKLVTDVRNQGNEFPLLVIAKVADSESFRAVETMNQIVLLEKPYEEKDLWGLVDKLTQGRRVAQRIHRRFFTDQNAQIENISTGTPSSTRVFNLSRGGAYMESEKFTAQTGELLKLSIDLKEVARQYVVNAKVVWTTPQGKEAGYPGIGVEFLKAGDVYRNLLSRL